MTRESLRDQATKDGLTGVWNRVAFLDLFGAELDRATRSAATTGLLMLDIDHFKTVNDRFGHLAGDLALKEVANRLKHQLRSYDFLGRYGGEEFMIALPGVTKLQLVEIAERIRIAVANEPVLLGTAQVTIKLSIGAVGVAPGEKDPAHAIAVADVALYHAKNVGRNCTVACLRPCVEVVQSDCSPHSLCSGCYGNSIAMSCVVESQSSQSDAFKLHKLWTVFPLEAGTPPMGDVRA
jgi:diguanylate cyclase (GGDEF)-like protein